MLYLILSPAPHYALNACFSTVCPRSVVRHAGRWGREGGIIFQNQNNKSHLKKTCCAEPSRNTGLVLVYPKLQKGVPMDELGSPEIEA
ncbi:jg23392 [Pararge aegeria aegeria]|uniref:Jg23392 protein n=1 Tax=Pararge aegeria aegeria TaxID=348720 RepID=A0A8S4RJV9_9NEOP|nr:jg23392 [Pararge aegeria aegeria]